MYLIPFAIAYLVVALNVAVIAKSCDYCMDSPNALLLGAAWPIVINILIIVALLHYPLIACVNIFERYAKLWRL